MAAFDATDRAFMAHALMLARQAEAAGEVPIGAVLVHGDRVIGEGFNQPISRSDPTAHAEIVALRDAGRALGNYRLPGTTLYVTLEPCCMCAGALIHARVDNVVFGAGDPKSGAAGGRFDLLPSDDRFNHHTGCVGGLMERECADLLQTFFRARR